MVPFTIAGGVSVSGPIFSSSGTVAPTAMFKVR